MDECLYIWWTLTPFYTGNPFETIHNICVQQCSRRIKKKHMTKIWLSCWLFSFSFLYFKKQRFMWECDWLRLYAHCCRERWSIRTHSHFFFFFPSFFILHATDVNSTCYACYRLDFIDKSMGSFCTYKLTLVADCGDIVAVVELADGGVIIHTPYL